MTVSWGAREPAHPAPYPAPPSHGARSQVGVLMLELSIQGKTTLLPVVAEQRCYGVYLAKRGTGRYLITGGWGQENKTLGRARLSKGAAPTPITSPFSLGIDHK